jgi:hypothetical protein
VLLAKVLAKSHLIDTASVVYLGWIAIGHQPAPAESASAKAEPLVRGLHPTQFR